MYSNIRHEAVCQPALYSLRRMTQEGSQTRNVPKGSYEMYDPQQPAVGSFGEKRINGIGGSAPGSPGSVHDYRQVIMGLQRELEESKRNGSELQNIIAEISSNNVQPSGSLTDSNFVEGSTTNDTVGESVKDAHIKHLQRQVTILQANLYKSEGWASRVGNSMKERDKAVDDVTRLTNHIKNLEGDNQQMQQRIEMLSATLQDTQQNLRQVTDELQSKTYNGQMVLHLQEEVQRQKAEIMSLKQSVEQLDQENRSLRDSGYGQSVGNTACSQELDHLHKVVDKLKGIALEQRAYLLQLKKPQNTRSFSSTNSSGNTGGIMSQDSSAGRKLASPTLRVPGSDVALGNLPQQTGLVQVNQTMGVRPASPKENFVESRSSALNKNFTVSDFGLEEVTDTRRKLSSRDVLDDVFNFEGLNQPHPALAQGEMLLASERQPEPHIGSSSYLVENVHHKKSPEFFGQHGSGDIAEKNVGRAGPTLVSQNVLVKSLPHRATQSEVMAYRKVAQENWGTKSEIIGRKSPNWNMALDNRSPTLMYKPAGNDVDKFVQVSPGLITNHGQRFMPTKQGQKETGETTRNSSASDTQGQQVGNGSTMQMMFDNSAAAQYENVSHNSPPLQQRQLIYHPPTKCQQGSAHAVNNDTITGGKQTASRAPAPCAPSHKAPGQDVLYVNTSSGQSSSTLISSSPVDLDQSRPRQNSDRLCPVCSHDYSHVSMEDFQTHVLDCFEDENPPETMKPHVPPCRLCPMCNTRFDHGTSQSEFERHVHSHFGEDCIGENFEILP